MNFKKRLNEIEERKKEIRTMMEGEDDVNLDEVEQELRNLNDEEKDLQNKQDRAQKINEGLETEARTIEKPVEGRDKMDFSEMTGDELRNTNEYRNAYLKSLQGKSLNETEERALTTGSGSAGAAVPTQTLNRIIDKLRQVSALFPKIRVSYIPGNVKMAVADAKHSANWKAEGKDGTAEEDNVKEVQLTGFELIKLVEISAAASAMSIDAFEDYISAEIGRQMSIAVENVILNGSGSGEPTGILEGVSWTNNENQVEYSGEAIVYDNLVDTLGLLPTMYHNNAEFVMNRKTLFGHVRKIKTDDGSPIFTYNPQDDAAMSILGYPVVLDDYIADGEVLFGDLSYYHMNFSQEPTVDKSSEAGFKSGKLVYRGLAVADGKPALDEAFVRLTEASA